MLVPSEIDELLSKIQCLQNKVIEGRLPPQLSSPLTIHGRVQRIAVELDLSQFEVEQLKKLARLHVHLPPLVMVVLRAARAARKETEGAPYFDYPPSYFNERREQRIQESEYIPPVADVREHMIKGLTHDRIYGYKLRVPGHGTGIKCSCCYCELRKNAPWSRSEAEARVDHLAAQCQVYGETSALAYTRAMTSGDVQGRDTDHSELGS